MRQVLLSMLLLLLISSCGVLANQNEAFDNLEQAQRDAEKLIATTDVGPLDGWEVKDLVTGCPCNCGLRTAEATLRGQYDSQEVVSLIGSTAATMDHSATEPEVFPGSGWVTRVHLRNSLTLVALADGGIATVFISTGCYSMSDS